MDLHEIKKKLVSKSERVKAVDLHPHESWVVAGLYTGHVTLWNFDTNTCIKTFDIVDVPIRSVKFIAREHWFICGADDLHCRIFNYNTMEKVHQFEAHQDYIRSVAVHPNLSLVLTSSDDMTVKLWDWSKSWMLVRTFEGHTHYVMCVVFNPKDPSTFATASLDHTVKVWNINSSSPNITLEHEKGVNCVHYYPKNDKPYLASGGDDKLVKIWDYQTKACIHTLSNHYNNVSSVWFHSELPLLITGSEDESFQLYDVQTFRMEKTLNFAMGRIWYLDSKTGNNVAIAMDRGLMVIGIGRDEPCFTMDQNGKIVISANREILKGDVRACVSENASLEVKDAEKLNMQWKELSVMEAVPYKLEYNCTGQFICVLSNGEYSINSALTWRSKTYGTALSFAWGAENGQYTVLEDEMTIKTFRNFKQKDALRLTEKSSSLTGGAGLIAVISNRTVLRFYDWEQLVLIRMIELPSDIRSICWSDAGTQVAIITEERTFLLQYKREEIANLLQTGHKGDPVDGFDIAFEMSDELDEKIQRAQWIGETLLFTTTTNRLCYHIAGNTYTVTLFDYPVFLLGYLYKENRAYFIDKERHVVSFRVASSVLEFKSIVTSGGDATEAVRSYASKIPPADLPRVGKFLEHQGFKELAMNVTTDQEHKFTLAIALGCLDVARNIAQKERREDKWRRLGDVALRIGDFDLAEEAFLTSRDCASLIMLYSALGSIDGMRNVSILAEQLQQHNIAFMAAYVTGDRSRCTQLLCASKRLPEAAVFSLAHGASRAEISHLVQKWKMDVGMVNKRLAESIADPMEFPNLFPAIPEEETLMSQSSPSHNAESGLHTSPWLNKASGTMGSEAAASINASLGSALGLSTEDPDTEGTTSSPSAFDSGHVMPPKADGSLDNSNRELDDIFGDVQ